MQVQRRKGYGLTSEYQSYESYFKENVIIHCVWAWYKSVIIAFGKYRQEEEEKEEKQEEEEDCKIIFSYVQ